MPKESPLMDELKIALGRNLDAERIVSVTRDFSSSLSGDEIYQLVGGLDRLQWDYSPMRLGHLTHQYNRCGLKGHADLCLAISTLLTMDGFLESRADKYLSDGYLYPILNLSSIAEHVIKESNNQVAVAEPPGPLIFGGTLTLLPNEREEILEISKLAMVETAKSLLSFQNLLDGNQIEVDYAFNSPINMLDRVLRGNVHSSLHLAECEPFQRLDEISMTEDSESSLRLYIEKVKANFTDLL